MGKIKRLNLLCAMVFLIAATSSNASTLIDVAFTTSSATSKTGSAATGVTANDFWNTCTASYVSGSVTNLKYVDGNTSGATLTLNDDGVGDYGNGASDLMYGTYIYTPGVTMSVTVTALAAATYDIYVYGHGNLNNQNSIYQISVGLQNYGSEGTTNGSGWISAVWQEGVQYVEFTNVSVFAGQTVNITVGLGSGGYAVLSGLQMANVGPPSNNPFIVTQPTNVIAIDGSNACFSVAAGGLQPFSYAWQFEGTNLPNATNSTLVLSNFNPSQSGSYAALVSNMYGSTLSSTAVLTALPQIITVQPQPASQTAVVGQNISYNVGVATVAPVSYQWQFGGTNLPGATNATLVLNNVNQFESGSYTILVSNIYGSTLSSTAALTVLPQIITAQPQPASQTAALGENISFGVGVETVAPVSYQWYFNGTNLAGATNALLTLTGVTSLNSGSYAVLVSNEFGTTLSSAIALSVVVDSVSTQSPNQSLYDAFLLASTTLLPLGTEVWFQWGITTNYGLVTPATDLQNTNSLSISNLVTGLTPYTVYHYQAVASNIYGTFFGGDVSFTTVPRFIQAGTNTGWSAMDISGDGHELVGTIGGIVYISTNLGATFSPTAGIGSVCAISSNGSTILAASGSNICASMNYGLTWITYGTPAAFTRFAASSNAQNLVALNGTINIYTSTNFGVTWSENTLPNAPTCVASSSDGSRLYAGSSIFPGESPVAYVYISTNSGKTWTTQAFPGLIGLSSIACSADGSTIAVSSEIVFVSTNGGTSWSYCNLIYGDGSIFMSANGQTIISSGEEPEYEVSPNAGASWFEPNPITLKGSVVCSADGRTLALLDGVIYISLPAPSKPSGLSVANAAGTPVFQLTGQPGYNYLVQASTDLLNWVNIATVLNTNGTTSFTDPYSSNYPARFYRAVAP